MTDYKLKGANLKYVAENILTVSRFASGPVPLYVTFFAASNASRDKVIEIFTSIYNVKSARKSDTDYGKIVFQFNTPADAEDCLKDVVGAVEQYQAAHPNVTPENNFYNHVDDDDPDTDKKAIDWTTYIIIGAAVVAIIILLWPNKRRK